MSLRTFHLIFILASSAVLGISAVWCIYNKHITMGIVSVAAEFGLLGYVFWFDRKAPKGSE